MPLPPSGTYLVTKVDGNDNFIEEEFNSEDISALGGALYSELISTSGELQSDIDAITRSNYVLVKALNNFPTPVGDIITLVEDTIYEINGALDLGTNRLVLENDVTLMGRTHLSDSLSYSGTGSMITILDGSATIDELKIDAPVSGSRAIIFSGTLAAGNHLHLTNTHFGDTGVYEVALIQEGEGVFIQDCSFSSFVTQGITISGNLGHLTIEDCRFESTQSGCITLTVQSGSYGVLSINGNHVNSYPSQTVFNIPNITTIEAGYIRENIIASISGGGTALSGGLDNNNVHWYIKSNEGLQDFKIYSLIKFVSNTTATTIADSAEYYVASGTNDSSSNAQRFDISVNNRAKYIGRETEILDISLTGSISCASANETLRIAVFKHDDLLNTDTSIVETEVRVSAANQSAVAAIVDAIEMRTNDYLEVRVRNVTDTTNVTVEFMQFKVFK